MPGAVGFGRGMAVTSLMERELVRTIHGLPALGAAGALDVQVRP